MRTFLLWIVKNYRFLFWAVMGMILGTCYVKMWNMGDVFSKEYLIMYVNSEIIYSEVWQEVISHRLKNFVTLLMFMVTPLKKLYVYWLCLYNGFCLGLCMAKSVMYNGIKGIAIVFMWLIPHYIIYIMTVLLMCHYFLKGIDTTRKTVIITSLSLLLTLIGTFVESYINPDIIKWFLNKVCNII